MGSKITVTQLKEMKNKSNKITALTAYDVQTARLLDSTGIEVILVGDSLGMVVMGYENTLPVTMEEMLHHARAVTRGVNRSLVVADMPFMSYQTGVNDAMINAARFMKDAGVQGVKLEGGRSILPQIRALVDAGIPVMGHLGLTPQSVHQLGGFKVQGKEDIQAERILTEALELEKAGIFALVLECIPVTLAREITRKLKIPTIGIGAGSDCDGQILVIQDLLGMDTDFKPKFVRRYANLQRVITEAVQKYIVDVKNMQFPNVDESFDTLKIDGDSPTKLYSGGGDDENL